MHFQRNLFGLALLVLLVHAPYAAAGLCAPESRTIPSASGEYLLVLLTPKEERDYRWEGSIAEQDRIEAKYPQSGLYRNDGSTKLLWPIHYFCTAKDIDVCDDGVHLVVTYLYWNDGVSDRGNALEFYANGNQLATYNEDDLLPCYQARLYSNCLVGASWPEGTEAVFDEAAGTFSFETNWGDAFQFDIRTGDLVSSQLPWSFKVLTSTAIGSLLLTLLLGGWLLHRALKRKVR